MGGKLKQVFILAVLALCLGLSATPSLTAEPDLLESALSAAAHSLDALLMNTLGSLELIAAMPEAQHGDWQGLRPYLQKLEQNMPAAYFYALPDGNYYSLELGFTNLNIGNREYFADLQAGRQVRGFPIHSRSTGRKAALMACPVMVGGKFKGALGASVYLDELQERLSREWPLPEDCTWFAVNSAGVTILDREADYIFLNARSEGSPSLKEALDKALLAGQGSIAYELGGVKREGFFRKLPSLDWWMVLVRKGAQSAPPNPRLEFSLARFTPELQATLNRIDDTVAAHLKQAKDAPLSEQGLRKLLAAIYRDEEAAINVSYIDGKGVLLYVEAPEYQNHEGTDISGQEQVAEMIRKPRPMLSKVFTAVQGFYAVTVSYPVLDQKGKFAGSVSVLLRPDLILRKLLGKLDIPPEHDLWIMQTDGQIVYDRDAEEIGRMLFSDPLYAPYESLLTLGRSIAAKPSGTGEYIFESSWGQSKVIKQASWDTVRLHGTEWRLVLTWFPYQD